LVPEEVSPVLAGANFLFVYLSFSLTPSLFVAFSPS
jgi:hypothetical protein